VQLSLDFGARAELADIRDELRRAFGPYESTPTLTPVAQLVKSMISSRTYDAVSLAAYGRLTSRFPAWADLAAASAQAVEAVIFDVRWPERKAPQLVEILRILRRRHPDYELDFLGLKSVTEALAWLEALPGVGRKIAASTINFSTLQRPALVIDTHVLRVLRRMGLTDWRARTAAAYDRVMPALSSWSATELQELHVLLKHLGQNVCRASRPVCARCPIRSRCRGLPRSVLPARRTELARSAKPPR
jgi:endonuclease-3